MKTNFAKIVFNKEFHTYNLDGRQLTPVTSVVKQVKKPFDSDYWSKKKAAERGITPEQILQEWDASAQASRELGTRVHEHIERVIRDGLGDPFLALNDKTPEMLAFELLWPTLESIVQSHRLEWVIGDEEMGIAGTTDAVFFSHQTELHHIWDWKTGKRFDISNRWANLLEPFEDLPECELNVYSLQTSIYRLILERNTDLEMGDSYIVHLSRTGEYKVYKALDLRSRVEEWLKQTT